MWEGTILAPLEDADFLESLGIILGEYDAEHEEFTNCKVSDETLDRLDQYWHRYYWSLN